MYLMNDSSTQTALQARTSIGVLMRDLAAAFNQQMFFWGRDAIHPSGSLFLKSGFRKRPSEGLQGTSCYTLPWKNGIIELHGSHAGWFGNGGGFLFVRPLGRCVRWLNENTPVPGKWLANDYQTSADESLHEMAIPFLDWWLDHEQTLERLAGRAYRQECHRLFGKLPKTRPWLAPQEAVNWITILRDEPSTLPRAKHFTGTV